MSEIDSDSDSSVELVQCRNVGSRASFDGSSSSSSSRESTQVAPILHSIESPMIGAVITALSATNTMRNAFSNKGIDIQEEIKYDPNWFRKMPNECERLEVDEREWAQAVRIELQILGAFLQGKFERLLASTGNLESLFNARADASERPEYDIAQTFRFLVSVPEFFNVIMQSVMVDIERIPAIPLPVDAEGFSGSLRNALDRAFWPISSEFEDEVMRNVFQVPILEPLRDVLVFQFKWAEIDLDQEIWPERYTKGYRSAVRDNLLARKEREAKTELIREQIQSKSEVNGAPLLNALAVASESLAAAGFSEASSELSSKLDIQKSNIQELMETLDSLELHSAVTECRNDLLSVDTSAMTPYILKALIWVDFSGDGPITIIRQSESDDRWLYAHNNETFFLSWSDILKFTKKTSDFVTVFEKKGVPSNTALAPSVEKFLQDEAESLASMRTPSESESDSETFASNHGEDQQGSTVHQESANADISDASSSSIGEVQFQINHGGS